MYAHFLGAYLKWKKSHHKIIKGSQFLLKKKKELHFYFFLMPKLCQIQPKVIKCAFISFIIGILAETEHLKLPTQATTTNFILN